MICCAVLKKIFHRRTIAIWYLKSWTMDRTEPMQNIAKQNIASSIVVRRSSRCEASSHIPEHCPFRMQTKLNHIILHTFSPSLLPTRTSHPCHHISTGRHPIISTLTQSSPLYKSTLGFLSFSHIRTSISPSSVPSSPDYADLLSLSHRFQFHSFLKLWISNCNIRWSDFYHFLLM